MENNNNKISIFLYTDYRKYLADYYHLQKQTRKVFSYRFFAKKAGINSIGLYKDIVEGRQNLGRALIYKFSSAIGHTKKEAEYFENMVFFGESKNNDERKLFFERMIGCVSTPARIIDSARFEYYQKWYYSAIRALITCHEFHDSEEDYKNIAVLLSPQILPRHAKKALVILEKLGFIAKNEQDIFILTDSCITTGSLTSEKNVSSVNVVTFQKEMIKLSAEAFDRFSFEAINMSTMTLCVSEKTMLEIKEELAAIRNKISSLAKNDQQADRIYQLNMQLFPLSAQVNRGNA